LAGVGYDIVGAPRLDQSDSDAPPIVTHKRHRAAATLRRCGEDGA
jgi:hypothetical protein